MATTVHAYVLAPKDTRPSASTVPTEKLDMFSIKFRCFPMIPLHFYGPLTSSKMATEIPLNLVVLRVLHLIEYTKSTTARYL